MLVRDHRNLDVFHDADALVIAIYAATKQFPSEERYGMTSQLRRAAVSVPCNIVEGSARHGEREFLQHLRIGFGSLREVGYLIGLAHRLKYYDIQTRDELDMRYNACARKLAALIKSFSKSTNH